MILKGEECYYLVVKKSPALLKATTSKHDDSFYYLNGLHSFRKKHKLESHKQVKILKYRFKNSNNKKKKNLVIL